MKDESKYKKEVSEDKEETSKDKEKASEDKKSESKSQLKFFIFNKNPDTPKIVEKLVPDKLRNNHLIKVINEYRNLVYQLIDGWKSKKNQHINYPLYWGLNENSEQLSIGLIGCGEIGIEFIKVCYWCGQLLKKDGNKLPLVINIYSKNAKEIEAKIPELFSGSVDDRGRQLKKYATFKVTEVEFNKFSFRKVLVDLKDLDYILIALGDDSLNIEVANKLAREMNNLKIVDPQKVKVPISYIVEDNNLCRELKKFGKNEIGCILNPFGSLSERYNIDNIYMTEQENDGYIDQLCEEKKHNEFSFLNKNYEVNSSSASEFHFPYKYFSLNNFNNIEYLEREYTTIEDFEMQKAKIYYLEHRRWVAYMSTTCYRCATTTEFLAYIRGKIDNMSLKLKTGRFDTDDEFHLHMCMIESSRELTSLEEMKNNCKGGYNKCQSELIENIIDKPINENNLENWLENLHIILIR